MTESATLLSVSLSVLAPAIVLIAGIAATWFISKAIDCGCPAREA